MTTAAIMPRLKKSFLAAAGTIVFGMEDGTVSIFGLVFGVAATTTSSLAVLVAGTSGAAAAAVSMMAGAYLDAETDRDTQKASRASLEADFRVEPGRDCQATIDPAGRRRADAPAIHGADFVAVERDPLALKGLLLAIEAGTNEQQSPREQALWMLAADFFSAAVPIVPFMLLPIGQARIVSRRHHDRAADGARRRAGADRRLGPILRTVAETVSVGIAAALAGVAIRPTDRPQLRATISTTFLPFCPLPPCPPPCPLLAPLPLPPPPPPPGSNLACCVPLAARGRRARPPLAALLQRARARTPTCLPLAMPPATVPAACHPLPPTTTPPF